ncbi:hypothetical protein [Candidatus Soleaferrea massiliensis]|uniref:hypothetical protein n=1 Tax=Candidatus Soleaferrea massiliensis TaxID=1470354 RepID=UPI0012E00B69|nr:hypothetical protein [Candidatus Soleaferrea massiliensis]
MKSQTVKTAGEIASLADQLTPNDQSYVLNTINALLYTQQTEPYQKKEGQTPHDKGG